LFVENIASSFELNFNPSLAGNALSGIVMRYILFSCGHNKPWRPLATTKHAPKKL